MLSSQALKQIVTELRPITICSIRPNLLDAVPSCIRFPIAVARLGDSREAGLGKRVDGKEAIISGSLVLAEGLF